MKIFKTCLILASILSTLGLRAESEPIRCVDYTGLWRGGCSGNEEDLKLFDIANKTQFYQEGCSKFATIDYWTKKDLKTGKEINLKVEAATYHIDVKNTSKLSMPTEQGELEILSVNLVGNWHTKNELGVYDSLRYRFDVSYMDASGKTVSFSRTSYNKIQGNKMDVKLFKNQDGTEIEALTCSFTRVKK